MIAKDRVYKELHQAINMSPTELGAWLRTDIAPIAVANYKDSPSLEQSKKMLRLLMKPLADVNSADCQFLQIMLQRLRYLKRSRNREPNQKLDWENSLRNLGYDIRKEGGQNSSHFFDSRSTKNERRNSRF